MFKVSLWLFFIVYLVDPWYSSAQDFISKDKVLVEVREACFW